jgi:hypothetical protein
MFTHLSDAVPCQNLIRSKNGLISLFPREWDASYIFGATLKSGQAAQS